MYFVLRLLAVVIFVVVLFIGCCVYCLFSPRNPKHVYTFGRLFGKLSGLFGIKLNLRQSKEALNVGKCVYVANHQNNWDLVTVSNAIRPGAVTVGKKSLVFIPFFGAIYYLTGNILIDRNNRSKAVGTIDQIVEKIQARDISVWLFPEGTRSRGRGLLPFKTGAFHAAIAAGVPIVPIVCSSTKDLDVMRGNNGHVIVEMLAPISTEGLSKSDVRELMGKCHDIMADKLAQLDKDVLDLNKK